MRAPPEKLGYFYLGAENSARELSSIKKDLTDWLYYNCRLTVVVHEELGIHQSPQERERDFTIRLQQAARERRDLEVDKLEEQFDRQISRLEDKLRKAERTLAADEADHSARKHQEWTGIREVYSGAQPAEHPNPQYRC